MDLTAEPIVKIHSGLLMIMTIIIIIIMIINKMCEARQKLRQEKIITIKIQFLTFHCPITVNFHYLGPIHIKTSKTGNFRILV